MAKIWNDIEITWDDEAYTVRPSMEFINYLEADDGCSLSKMYVRLSKQDLPSGQACQLIAKTLRYAGADVTAEDVFMETNGGIGVDAITLASQILVGCMPAPKNPPKSTAKKKKVAK